MTKPKNRNYQRIDNLIVNAFKELVKVSDAEKIGVTTLCKKAGVNRTTFYKHYSDTSQIVVKLEEEVILNLLKAIGEEVKIDQFISNSLFYLRKYNETIIKDIEFYRQVFRPTRVRFIVDRTNEYVFNAIKRNSPEIYARYEKPSLLRVDIGFLVGAVTNLYLQWFRGFIDCSLETLAQMISKNVNYLYYTRLFNSKPVNKKIKI